MKIQQINSRNIVFSDDRADRFFDLNIHLIMGTKNNYLIDTGLGSEFVQPVLEYLEHSEKSLVIINTHHHWDHVFGNHVFKDHLIVSHQLCRELIIKNWDEMLDKYSKFGMGTVEQHLPNLVFENELYFPEDKVRLIYTPGHTIDSISVIDEEEKVINVADNIGDSMDEIIPNLYCDKQLFEETIKRYSEMDMETWISGHNVVLQKDVIGKIEEAMKKHSY
ncbi:MBL fold metallo-hydrolase [Paenibacillus sp. N1-5-1-14]|uniref:MBL fold metallo-hydrolase n=1 Tax=Paenibacillus radicibacter TaxID=2972488 RepID=UPI0021597DA0|nr:MBL fold metallo-hydrolase [Paenibacillus radicibacter]MCR8642001.1 MBL fold metallo-hydrolase [Paenibacillus radicibacter]